MRVIAEIVGFLKQHRRWVMMLGVLNGLDLLLTWTLIRGGTAYEVNPLAAHLLDTYGWWGMAGLKIFSMLLVIGTAIFIAQRHVASLRRLLRSTCGITAAVVAYSLFLVVQAHAENEPEQWLENEQERGAALDRRWFQAREYRREVDRLANSLITGRVSLSAAVKDLAPCVERLDRDPLARMSRELSELDTEPRAAVYLLNAVGYILREQPVKSRQLYRRLHHEFVTHYGEPASFAVLWFARAGANRGGQTWRIAAQRRPVSS